VNGFRIAGAAVAGYATAALGAFVGAMLAGTLFPQAPQEMPATAYLGIAIAVAFLASILAGYVSARIAGPGQRLISLALLVLIVFGMSALQARMPSGRPEPPGYLPAVTMLSVIGVWAGAMIERAVGGGGRVL